MTTSFLFTRKGLEEQDIQRDLDERKREAAELAELDEDSDDSDAVFLPPTREPTKKVDHFEARGSLNRPGSARAAFMEHKDSLAAPTSVIEDIQSFPFDDTSVRAEEAPAITPVDLRSYLSFQPPSPQRPENVSKPRRLSARTKHGDMDLRSSLRIVSQIPDHPEESHEDINNEKPEPGAREASPDHTIPFPEPQDQPSLSIPPSDVPKSQSERPATRTTMIMAQELHQKLKNPTSKPPISTASRTTSSPPVALKSTFGKTLLPPQNLTQAAGIFNCSDSKSQHETNGPAKSNAFDSASVMSMGPTKVAMESMKEALKRVIAFNGSADPPEDDLPPATLAGSSFVYTEGAHPEIHQSMLRTKDDILRTFQAPPQPPSPHNAPVPWESRYPTHRIQAEPEPEPSPPSPETLEPDVEPVSVEPEPETEFLIPSFEAKHYRNLYGQLMVQRQQICASDARARIAFTQKMKRVVQVLPLSCFCLTLCSTFGK
jgi:hypothetical protein